MLDKNKKITNEELNNVSGGGCGDDEGTMECPNCKSYNNTYDYCAYEERKYTCKDCGTKWLVDAGGNIYQVYKD